MIIYVVSKRFTGTEEPDYIVYYGWVALRGKSTRFRCWSGLSTTGLGCGMSMMGLAGRF